MVLARLALVTGALSIAAGCGRLQFDVLADSGEVRVLAEQAYIKASNTDTGDLFGYTVALSADGSTLAIGARFESSAATGVDGDQTSNAASHAGAVYVFARSGTTWVQEAYLKASNAGAGDLFCVGLALSADGSTLAAGANAEASAATGIDGNQGDNSAAIAGAVYVFVRAGATWTQQAYVKASNTGAGDEFGYAVALSADGSTLAVGANREDSAAVGIGGNQADNSAVDAGAVYVFSRAGATWGQQAYVKASNADAGDRFGVRVALSDDGATLAVGAFVEASAAIGIDGNQLDNSAPGAGAVYAFTRTGSTWSQAAYLKASNTGAGDQLGASVALSGDGMTLAAGAYDEASASVDPSDDSAPGAGAVYVFTRAGAGWSQQAYLKASNPDAADRFGNMVALSLDGSTLIVGADRESSASTGIDGAQTDNTAASSGAAYVLSRTGITWQQQWYVKPSNTDTDDGFTSTLAFSRDGATLAVGSPDEDSSATGVGGDEQSNAAASAGAVYLFGASVER